MKRVHPKLSCSAIRAAIAFSFVVAGCRSSSSGVAGNPFMSPDRVPPPNTRGLLPGQAQPYYQGDPLPAMQSATKPAANAIAANPAETDSRSSTGRTLAWSQPGTAAPAPTSVAPPQAIAATNEASVAVPTDANPLRFPLPTPREPGTVAPIAAAALRKTSNRFSRLPHNSSPTSYSHLTMRRCQSLRLSPLIPRR